MNEGLYHHLLERQISKASKDQSSVDYERLFKSVSQAYEDYDKARVMNDRAMQLMSDELTELNEKIRLDAKNRIEETEKRFKLAVEGANDGIWDWNIKTGEIWHSDRCREMLGYEDSELPEDVAVWWDLLLDEDKPAAEKVYHDHIENDAPYNITLRFNHKNGSLVYILCRASTMRDENNEPYRMVGTYTDLTKIMEMQRNLEKARDAAESANRAKSEFLANMSHELRTPMHGILSYSELGIGKLGNVPEDKIKHYLESINKSGKRLLHLLNDLLDLSKLEAREIKIEAKESDLLRIIDSVVTELRPLAQKKNVNLEVAKEGETMFALFDHDKIMQVVTNILGNAIKFTHEGKNIVISCTKTILKGEDNSESIPAVSVSVKDEGIGIPEDELDKIFERFVQSSKTNTGAGGTGLGLSICKEIITAHKGKIWAENKEKGGAMISFIIPISG